MPILYLRGISDELYHNVKQWARSRGVSVRQFVLDAAQLWAHLEEAVATLTRRGQLVPTCPYPLSRPGAREGEAHLWLCPICRARYVQLSGRREYLSPWLNLAEAVGAKPTELDRLRKIASELPEEIFKVLVKRYGLDGSTPKTLAEIARERGVSRQRVWQQEQSAISRLWKEFQGEASKQAPGGEGANVGPLEIDEEGYLVVHHVPDPE